MYFQNLADRGAHRQLPQTRPLNLTAHSVYFCSAVLCVTEFLKPIRAVLNDVWQVAQRLDVLHDRGLAEKSGYLGIGRLGARISALTLERIQQPGLFAAHISSAAHVNMHLQAVARAKYVLAKIVELEKHSNGPPQAIYRNHVHATQKDIGH